MTAEQAARQAYLDDVIDVAQFEADLEAAIWHEDPSRMSFESRQHMVRFTAIPLTFTPMLKQMWTEPQVMYPPQHPTEQP